MKRSSAEIYVVVFYMMTITNLKKAFDGVFLKKRLQQEEIKFHIDLIMTLPNSYSNPLQK